MQVLVDLLESVQDLTLFDSATCTRHDGACMGSVTDRFTSLRQVSFMPITGGEMEADAELVLAKLRDQHEGTSKV